MKATMSYGTATTNASESAGPLLECTDGHERVTWRGPPDDPCFVCEQPGQLVGYPPE